MRPDDIAHMLRSAPGYDSPLDKIELLKSLIGEQVTQFDFIRYFKCAFPEIPLRTWTELSTTRRLIPNYGMPDDEVMERLEPWLNLFNPKLVVN